MSRPYRLLRGLLATRSRIPMVRLVPWGGAVVQERVGTKRHLPARGTAHSRHSSASGLIGFNWARFARLPADRAGVGYTLPALIASLLVSQLGLFVSPKGLPSGPHPSQILPNSAASTRRHSVIRSRHRLNRLAAAVCALVFGAATAARAQRVSGTLRDSLINAFLLRARRSGYPAS
jgi:hypothetical protein